MQHQLALLRNVNEDRTLYVRREWSHKKLPDMGIPKSRAVTDASECSTFQLGNSLAMLLEACIKSQD